MASTAAQVEKLMKRRNTLILQLKRQFEPSLQFTEETDIYLINARAERLAALWPAYEEVNLSLESKSPNFTEILIENLEYEDLEMTVRIHLSKLLEKKSPPKPDEQTVTEFHDDEEEIKLPPDNIKPFSGAANEWIRFRNIFLGLIHERKSMRSVKKMQYLKLYTTGEAADAIKHMPVDNEHYELAWKRLEDRYHNPRILIDSYLDRFFNQPSVSPKNAMAIRRLIDITNETLHMIEKLGASTDN
jgi:hypothetical protein